MRGVSRAVGILVALGLVLAACTDDKDSGPSPDPDATTSTSLTDYSGVDLPDIGGETTTAIDEKGTTVLTGTVTGPDGPLWVAKVRIDRLVAGRVVRHDVFTNEEGKWELRNVPGGRYRVRAFRAPVYAQDGAVVQFLDEGKEYKFDLKVEDQRGALVRADVAPDLPLLDGAVNLVVLVVQRTVSADGVVRSAPLANTFVELTGLGRWVVRDGSGTDGGTDSTDSTDDTTSTTFDDGSSTADQGAVLSSAGRARFELRCVASGAPRLSLRIPVVVVAEPAPAPPASGSTTTTEPVVTSQTVALELPSCVDPATTTTTTTPPSSVP